jgi:hypothetical protein
MPADLKTLPPSEDAALALALAETAMPFADSGPAEVEHWIRILRMHGEVGQAMQALGAGESPLDDPGDDGPRIEVGEVYRLASLAAAERDEQLVATTDLLTALLHSYGDAFERGLGAHGVSANELLERLGHKF